MRAGDKKKEKKREYEKLQKKKRQKIAKKIAGRARGRCGWAAHQGAVHEPLEALGEGRRGSAPEVAGGGQQGACRAAWEST